jgi:hypothetical protein
MQLEVGVCCIVGGEERRGARSDRDRENNGNDSQNDSNADECTYCTFSWIASKEMA